MRTGPFPVKVYKGDPARAGTQVVEIDSETVSELHWQKFDNYDNFQHKNRLSVTCRWCRVTWFVPKNSPDQSRTCNTCRDNGAGQK